MDSLAMVTLTVPILYPTVQALGFDPIWFGVIIVLVVEMGVITPPVGINVYIIKGVAPDVPMGKIFRGRAAVLGRHGDPGGPADDLSGAGYLAAELHHLLTTLVQRGRRSAGPTWGWCERRGALEMFRRRYPVEVRTHFLGDGHDDPDHGLLGSGHLEGSDSDRFVTGVTGELLNNLAGFVVSTP